MTILSVCMTQIWLKIINDLKFQRWKSLLFWFYWYIIKVQFMFSLSIVINVFSINRELLRLIFFLLKITNASNIIKSNLINIYEQNIKCRRVQESTIIFICRKKMTRAIKSNFKKIMHLYFYILKLISFFLYISKR